MVKIIQSKHCKFCDRQAPAFQYLNSDELDLINKNRYEITYNPGEIIFKQESPNTHVLSFTSGLAKIYLEGSNNRQLILRLVKPVDFIAGPGLYENDVHPLSLAAVERSSVCVIDKRAFQTVFRGNTYFAEAFLKTINNNYLAVLKKLNSISNKQSKGKVAETLLYLADEIYEKNCFDLTISIGELSHYFGLSKESTFRILKEFSDDRIVSISKKRIEILNRDQLNEISEKG